MSVSEAKVEPKTTFSERAVERRNEVQHVVDYDETALSVIMR